MDAIITLDPTRPLVVHFGKFLQRASDREFLEFCELNRDLRFERTAEGDLIIMPPTGGETGKINFRLNVYFGMWAEKDGTGISFDSSTGFILRNGARRSPDLAWIKRERWQALSQIEREEFVPLCPDFVIEIRSKSDSLIELQAKMREYIGNGVALGWLIDPGARQVYVYRAGMLVERLDQPPTISGDPLLRGFTLNLDRLWE